MGSTRLPGKVLLPADGKPMLAHLVDRLRQVPSIEDIVLATTDSQADDELVTFATRQGIRSFRGSEEDVMGRVIAAAESAGADVVVEITGDCPVIDPRVVGQAIRMYEGNDCAYLSNVVVRSYPVGMDTQVFALDTLKRSAAMTDEPLDREHVTRHIRLNPGLFSHTHLVAAPDETWPELELTLDERGDYELLRRVIEHFGQGNRYFTCREAIELLAHRHPEWVELNASVQRKGLG